MNDSDGKIHYDYMTVRANDISECGHYSAFGWIYIADDSERGGRDYFRIIICPSVQAQLDTKQKENEKMLLKIRKIGEKARLCGVAVAAVTLLIGIVAFINGMNMCIGETFRFNAAVSVAAGVFAFAAAYPVYTKTVSAAMLRRNAEENNHKVRIAQICGEARKIIGKSR